MSRISASELKYLRNEVPVRYVAEELCGYECKRVEGVERFVCPECYQMQTSFHPQENLGRCFRCQRNFNPIDFVMSGRKLTFKASVEYLRQNIRVKVK